MTQMTQITCEWQHVFAYPSFTKNRENQEPKTENKGASAQESAQSLFRDISRPYLL